MSSSIATGGGAGGGGAGGGSAAPTHEPLQGCSSAAALRGLQYSTLSGKKGQRWVQGGVGLSMPRHHGEVVVLLGTSGFWMQAQHLKLRLHFFGLW
eukprot:341515-Pelagomonas_calceolata.AAC.1